MTHQSSSISSFILDTFWAIYRAIRSAPGTNGPWHEWEQFENGMTHILWVNTLYRDKSKTNIFHFFDYRDLIRRRFLLDFPLFLCIYPWNNKRKFLVPDSPNPVANQRIPYQVKSDLLEFGDSVVLSPRRIDPRADKAGRPFWFFTIGIDSLAIR